MRRRRLMSAAVVVAAAGALAGCGVSTAGGSVQAGRRSAARVPLATSAAGSGASWAIVRMAGAGGQRDRFWQLLIRTAGSGHWRLATPPGVADTGGLAVAGTPGGTLTAGFVPSELLKFTPLAMTRDGGASWTQGLLSAPLAASPGALAALPGGRLLAITAHAAELSSPGATSWTDLVTLRTLAASPAGRACGLIGLTGVAVGAGGVPLLAGDCTRPGEVGIFAQDGSGWRAAGPALPSAVARQRTTVLRLVSTVTGAAALLAAGSGRGEVVIPAWLTRGAGAWAVGYPYGLLGRQVVSVSVGAQGGWGIALDDRHGLIFSGMPSAQPFGATLSDQGYMHRQVSLPASGAVLVVGPGLKPPVTALVPGDSAVTVWQLTTSSTWRQIQVLGVPASAGSPG